MYVWDIRGGRASATFQSHKEVISVLSGCSCYYIMKTHLKMSRVKAIWTKIMSVMHLLLPWRPNQGPSLLRLRQWHSAGSCYMA